MKRTPAVLLSAVLTLSSIATVQADDSDDLGTVLTSGKVGVNLRARYEGVDQDSFAAKADAITTRLRLNYRTGQWNGLTGFVEYDYIFHLLSDFDSGGGTTPAKGRFPVIADPKGSDLNQLYLDYSFTEKSKLRFGRQRILLDDHRFVGNVGWRQNGQTYDAITYTTTAIASTNLFYSYVGNVRRIFGERVSAGHNNVDTHLINAKVAINDSWSVTPYYYRIDNKDIAAFSTGTVGARLDGSIATSEEGKIVLLAEFATQSDVADNPVSYDAQFVHLSGLWSLPSGLSLGVAYESLGGDTVPGSMFRTPLATLHAFQGWADQFLATPPAGIDDAYATAKYQVGQWKLTGVYHDFSAETGSVDYGTELDVSIGRSYSDSYSILFKGAFFSADAAFGMPDTDKFWIMFTANY
jgi:hypothetical protein